jgi:hypothetical protein
MKPVINAVICFYDVHTKLERPTLTLVPLTHAQMIYLFLHLCQRICSTHAYEIPHTHAHLQGFLLHIS